jgi:hypothetical protein
LVDGQWQAVEPVLKNPDEIYTTHRWCLRLLIL